MQPPSRPGPSSAPLGPGDPQLIGGYRTLGRLGDGRWGPVYLGATQSGRRLAIKTVRPGLASDEAFRRRFKQEITSAQRVRGPFLVAVLDGHAEGASPWLACEYVPGPSLAQAVEAAGPLPAETVLTIIAAIAEALRAIHDADLVHGRLSPSNVLLAEDGPHVTDHAALDHAALDHADGPAQDVLALGRLALFAATGRTQDQRDDGEPDLTGCPDELRGPIERCLATDPTQRPEAGALVAELEQESPGPGWLPSGVAALLPAYQGDPPRPQPAPLPAPRPTFEPPWEPASPSSAGAPVTAVDPPEAGVMPVPQPRPAEGPNFAIPMEPPTMPNSMAQPVPPVMDSYRHDLAIALAIGAGAFGLLVLVLLFVFLL